MIRFIFTLAVIFSLFSCSNEKSATPHRARFIGSHNVLTIETSCNKGDTVCADYVKKKNLMHGWTVHYWIVGNYKVGDTIQNTGYLQIVDSVSTGLVILD